MAVSDLVSFERAAYGRTGPRARLMLELLKQLAVGRLVEDASRSDRVRPFATDVLNRLAAAVVSVLCDPDVELSETEADRAMVLKGTLTNLFTVSAFAGADFGVRAMGEAAAPPEQTAKHLLLQSLDTELDFDLEALFDLQPRAAQLAVAALIATRPVMTERGQRRRDRLLEMAPRLAPAVWPTTPDHLVLLSSAWMLCSYAATPAKHQVKTIFNRSLLDLARTIGLAPIASPAERTFKARPILLVAAEVMNSAHVQYRYFGRYLRQLRTRFELVLLTEHKEVDAAVEALFDRVLTFERRPGGAYFGEIRRMIADVAPDVIFWLSVGMRHWGPLFANLRLAPIQLVGLGHSASTFCQSIDYYLLEEGYVSDPALFGETVVTLPDESLVFERPPAQTPPTPSIRQTASPLRVALPSNILKLNPGFLALLARIRARAGRPLEFHVFPAADGLDLAAIHALFRRVLPGAQVHGRMEMSRYQAALSACDLTLSPFPFGGLHSVVDSLRQGLPVVAMECPEPHGRTDAMLLRRLGMPDWLVASDEDAYVAAALRLIDDDAERVALSRQALAAEVDKVLFGDAATPLRTEVVDAVWWIYSNHEAVQAAGRKLWSTADRAAISREGT